MALLFVTEVSAQAQKITGKVTEADGSPLPGVTVLVKGTTQGGVTADDGTFAVDGPPNSTWVGYSVGSLYGAKTDGVNPATGQRIFINRNGEKVQYSHAVPSGQSRWTYLDGSAAPAISVSEYQLLGNALPTWYGGFNNTFKYGSFDLGINFTAVV